MTSGGVRVGETTGVSEGVRVGETTTGGTSMQSYPVLTHSLAEQMAVTISEPSLHALVLVFPSLQPSSHAVVSSFTLHSPAMHCETPHLG